MADRKLVAAPFPAMGAAFVAIGITGNRAFTAVGLAFITLGCVRMVGR